MAKSGTHSAGKVMDIGYSAHKTDYSKIYDRYIAAHSTFDLSQNSLFQQYMNLGKDFSIVKNLSGLNRLSIDQLNELLGTDTTEDTKIWDSLLKGFNSAYEAIQDKSHVGKITSEIQFIAKFGKISRELNSIAAFLKSRGHSTRGAETIASSMMTRLKGIVDELISGNKTYGYTTARGKDVTLNLYKKDDQGNDIIDMAGIAKVVRDGVLKIADNFKENGLAIKLGQIARMGLEGEYLPTLIHHSLYSQGGQNTPSIVPSLRSKYLMVGGKDTYVASDELADITIVKDKSGSKYTGMIKLNKMANKFGLKGSVAGRISVKNYTSGVGQSTFELQGISRVIKAVIAAAAHGDVELEWALKKASTYPGELSPTSNQEVVVGLNGALLRQFAFDSIFGSDKDFISDFVINDNIYSGPYIASKLFANINKSRTKLITGSFSTLPNLTKAPKLNNVSKAYYLQKAHLEKNAEDAVNNIRFKTTWYIDHSWFK